eukprot:scaffold15853_cov73-Skeletonema_dohrnii-CCMP3373.AAC.1
MALESSAGGHLRCLNMYGNLGRCIDANTSNKCLSRAKDAFILSWPTIMGHYKLSIAIGTA